MREEGYYWVRTDNIWIVAQWFKYSSGFSCWLIPGNDRELLDDFFEEIDEKRLTHE